MLDCEMYGLRPLGHHLSNVLLHTAAVSLCFLALSRMTGALWPSAFVAALFAIHPLRVESVAWIAERKDVLSGLFFMLTLIAYRHYTRRPSFPRYLAIAAAFAAGLLSKPMLVTLPFILLLLDYWPLRRYANVQDTNTRLTILPPWRLIREKIPLLILSTGSCIATFWAQHGTVRSTEQLPLFWRIGNAVVACARYVRQMLWPVDLALFYPHPVNRLPVWQIVFSLAFLLSVTVTVIALARKRPYLLVGWFWFLGMLVPVIGIIQVGDQAGADRYTYLPHIGLYLLAAWGIADATARWNRCREVLAITAATVIVLLIILARTQASYWRNSESLWTHTLAVTGRNEIAYTNRGAFRLANGRVAEAIPDFEAALNIRPSSANTLNNLGMALARSGRREEAIAHFQRALTTNPQHSSAYFNLGNTLVEAGRFDEAVASYRKQLETQPDNAAVYLNLGYAFRQMGRPDDAIAQYRRVLEIEPQHADAHYKLANCLVAKDQLDDAIAHYNDAVNNAYGAAEVHDHLAFALFRKGRITEAIAHWEVVLALRPDDAAPRNNLAVALLKNSRAQEAIREWEKIIQSDRDNVEALLSVAWVLATWPEVPPRDGAKALNLAEEARRRRGDNSAVVLRTLAAAFAECGQFSQASLTAQRGIETALSQKDFALAENLQKEKRLYDAQSAVRAGSEASVSDKPSR
jgi:Flp pilus assembly protein TadD